MKAYVKNHSICSLNKKLLKEKRVSEEDVRRFLPDYIFKPIRLEYSLFQSIAFKTICEIAKMLVYLFLRPRSGKIDKLDAKEVDNVYSKEARGYDNKHHLTTCGSDLNWRRMAGWLLGTINRNNGNGDKLKVLDICTGTGLTVKEMAGISKNWGLKSEFIGLDYNAEMIKMAQEKISPNGNIRFVRGDATDMVQGNGPDNGGFAQFPINTFDIVTQMFGIGGIESFGKVFLDVLKVLKPGGYFYMIDMHQPLSVTAKDCFFWGWHKFPAFELFSYRKVTVPLVLNRLWGWRDPTICYYVLPLVAWRDEAGKWWGFETLTFEQESQKWWLGLPTMPIGKIIVKKVQLNKEEARKRNIILAAIIPRDKSRDFFFNFKNMLKY